MIKLKQLNKYLIIHIALIKTKKKSSRNFNNTSINNKANVYKIHLKTFFFKLSKLNLNSFKINSQTNSIIKT
jgi:hypothetical protein